jgi:hypothetical protein
MSQAVYRPREPQKSSYYQCVQDHFEAFELVYEERFERQYGFFRPYVSHVIYRYLDCGDLHNGFARVRYGDCGHEYILAFSCKRRHFCPLCHQKRVVEFGEWLCGDVVKAVPHRHVVFSIPKILRRCFLYDHKRLTDLSRCGWESLKAYFTSCSKHNGAVPGAVIAIQTFGDLLGYNPHLHVLITDGCFHPSGMLTVAPSIDTHALEQLFRHKILQMLLSLMDLLFWR